MRRKRQCTESNGFTARLIVDLQGTGGDERVECFQQIIVFGFSGQLHKRNHMTISVCESSEGSPPQFNS